MFSKLASRFARDFSASPVDERYVVAHAAAMLLFEVAWADHEILPEEIARVDVSLQALFGLPAGVAQDLAKQARSAHADATSIYPFTREVNDCLSAEERYRLMVALWQLALVDEAIAAHEEASIRNIAGLLHISHRDFIRAKLEARSLV